MTDGWVRLGRAIKAERARLGYRNAAAFARAAGLSKRTVELIESGAHPGTPRETTLARIETVLARGGRWGDGSWRRVVEGGRPVRPPDALLTRLSEAWPHLTSDMQVTIVLVAETLTKRRQT